MIFPDGGAYRFTVSGDGVVSGLKDEATGEAVPDEDLRDEFLTIAEVIYF